MREQFKLDTEYIELFKLLKAVNLCASGGEAKNLIAEGLVTLNSEIETRKRKKVYQGDLVKFDGTIIEVI